MTFLQILVEHGIQLALLASEAVEGALVAGGATTGAAAEDIAEPYLRTVATADAVALGDGTGHQRSSAKRISCND